MNIYERALIDLVTSESQPSATSPPDLLGEAAALASVRDEIEHLISGDPQVLRRHLAGSLLLCERIAAAYLARAEAANRSDAKATLAGIALRALNVGGRLAVILGASALATIPADASMSE